MSTASEQESAVWWVVIWCGVMVLVAGMVSCGMEQKIDALEAVIVKKDAEIGRLRGDLGIASTRALDEKARADRFEQAAKDQGAAAERCWSVLREKLDWKEALR